MSTKEGRKHRSFTAVEIAQAYDREMHELWCRAMDAKGHVPSDGISDIRRHRQFPWRIDGRRQLEAVLADVDESVFEEMEAARRRYREAIRAAKQRGLLKVRIVAIAA